MINTFHFQTCKTMATEEEVKPAKRGRGRPPKSESEKKAAAKRKAEPAVDEDGNPVVKKGRGRPPGSGGKKGKKAGKAGKGVSLIFYFAFGY